MTEPISDHDRLIGIEGDIKAIRAWMGEHPQIRHVDKNGDCLAYHTLVEHDRTLSRWESDIKKIDEHDMTINQWTSDVSKIPAHDVKINQWTGAMIAVGLLCSFIGGVIGALAVLLGWKRG